MEHRPSEVIRFRILDVQLGGALHVQPSNTGQEIEDQPGEIITLPILDAQPNGILKAQEVNTENDFIILLPPKPLTPPTREEWDAVQKRFSEFKKRVDELVP